MYLLCSPEHHPSPDCRRCNCIFSVPQCSGEQRRYSYTTGSQEKGAFLGNRKYTVTPPTVRRRVVFWGTEKIQLHHQQSGEGWCSGEQRRYSYTTDRQEKGGVLGNRDDTFTPLVVRKKVVFWGTQVIHLQHGQSGEGWCSGNREDRVTTPTVRRRVVFWGTEQIQ